MQKRRLGNSLKVLALGLGYLGMSFGYGTADDLREIDSATSAITVQSAGYPEEMERRTGP